MYQEDRDPMKELVESALVAYHKDEKNCGAGYNIIRYASQNMIEVDASVDPNVFVEWYPRHQGFVLLRLAKQGKLSYKGQEKN